MVTMYPTRVMNVGFRRGLKNHMYNEVFRPVTVLNHPSYISYVPTSRVFPVCNKKWMI